ncbi:MAG TPA: GtrA family protein [Solirubrobacteraceae bacterium]
MLLRRDFDLQQFARFAVVGVLQNGLNLLTFAAGITIEVPYLLASLLAAVVALAASFFLNLRWTFAARNGRTSARAARYVTIWVTIVLLGLPVLAVMVNIVHLPRIVAQAIVITIGAPISYFAQRRWTFSHTLS